MSSFKVSFFCVISIYVFDEAEVLFKQGFSIPSAWKILMKKKSSIDFENLLPC